VDLDQVGVTGVTIPVVEEEVWASLVTAVIGAEPDQSGAVVVYLVEDQAPAVGAEVYAPAESTFLPFYEGSGAEDWSQTGLTGPSGAALLFGVPSAGATTSFEADNQSGTGYRTVDGVAVADATTTFVTVDVTGE
jgi:hypothetical protein